MSEDDFSCSQIATELPVLPEPTLERWQPMRLGVLELFHYDAEEFWFHDGHLLFRGNNGTGKSKVLSLTLPFLFDANLRPSRIEPDGDSGKKMAWNLLVGSYKRRIGYTWIEFGRKDKDGRTFYLTLGAGLLAVEGRPSVDAWFFMLANPDGGGARMGRDFYLTNDQGHVLTRERLRDAIEGHGRLFENATSYRRAVDEKLFNLGEKRYDALMDTLIQLRQPQLSRKPDEAALSHALTEALPPMPSDMLTDVADSLNQLEEDRQQLDDTRQLHGAVDRFNKQYERYARIQSRRRARELRQAQTEFDNASQARNAAQSLLETAEIVEADAKGELEAADNHLHAQRARLETLQSNPTMQDANRLQNAEQDLSRRQRTVQNEEKENEVNSKRLKEEAERTEKYAAKVRANETSLREARNACVPHAERAGLAAQFVSNPIVIAPFPELGALEDKNFESLVLELRKATTIRRAEIDTIKQRRRAVDQAETRVTAFQQAVDDAKDDVNETLEKRAEADLAADQAGSELVDAWVSHLETLRQLKFDGDLHIPMLVEWVAKTDGENPAKRELQLAHRHYQSQHASAKATLDERRKTHALEVARLEEERDSLSAGRDPTPPAIYTRSPSIRASLSGAPFYTLVDFQQHVSDEQRAGIEAALEASGLLDAWITSDGNVLGTEDQPLPDATWTSRPAVSGESLVDWLQADCASDSAVAASVVERLLAGVACSADEALIDTASEAWVAPSGRFRLGSLCGAWAKSNALYIGQRARTAARLSRLDAIRIELDGLKVQIADVIAQSSLLDAEMLVADCELANAPAETSLRAAIQAVAVAVQTFQAARVRLDRAEAQSREAKSQHSEALEKLQNDATDLRLPSDEHELVSVEDALVYCTDEYHKLADFARDYRRAEPELSLQRAREEELNLRHLEGVDKLRDARRDAEEVAIQLQTLRETVGVEVAALLEKLAEAKIQVENKEKALQIANDARRVAAENRATAAQKAAGAQAVLDERIEARARAVSQLQRFASSSLLSSALPALDLPDLYIDWTIDPALTVARRIEQELSNVVDDDDSWARVQKHVNEDLMDLQRTLGALGHQALAATSDWGLVAQVVFHGRHERPDQLIGRLADEIAQRAQLLSAHERAVLENHLEAEIATEIQRMLRAAETQVNAVNKELEKRPTSTGVRYRLRWQPLTELEGAPVALEAARERLLNTSADLWTAEDRRVVGSMLHTQIKAERDRTESANPTTGAEGGSLFDQLARALDYRRWHRFRVERLQGGQWKKLSGPASSGERALGLTVPLFAAIASFYSQSSNPHAPRLMLLDEAFAGIDDLARAHCMGLIREFDLDFVITSEREWACYAELPGVAISQLQRKEGIDAIFVSRWVWDGVSRRRGPEPVRTIG
jgi:uncharacterized protein (TIGR02680 family)